MKAKRLWTLLTALVWLLIAWGVVSLSGPMAPVRDGQPLEFWEGLCRADFNADGQRPTFVDAYYVDEQWCVYDVGHLHGSDLYRVPTASVRSWLPQISHAIETNDALDLTSAVLVGHAAWRDGENEKTVEELVRRIKDERDRFWLHRDDTHLTYRFERRVDFWRRWRATRWYWATLVFDWLFLSGWLSFLLWPGIVGGRLWRWCLHLAVAMPLFFVPVYLGYSTYTFTSAGPTGGVLYPHLLGLLRGGSMTAEDIWLIERLPPVLESISVPIGSPMALTGMGMPGIIGVAEQGAIIGAAIWIGSLVGRWLIAGYFPQRDQTGAS